MLPDTMTFWSFLWLEFLVVSGIMVVFLLATLVFDYLQLVELKFTGAIIALTLTLAVTATMLRDIEWWRSLLFAFGAMFVSAAFWAAMILSANVLIERIRGQD